MKWQYKKFECPFCVIGKEDELPGPQLTQYMIYKAMVIIEYNEYVIAYNKPNKWSLEY